VRDRDAAGRARNARPRDALGRPLPHGAQGVPTIPDDLDLTPDETVAEAQRLFDEGMPFHAHEVLEAAWKTAGPETRELWRALAQYGAGLTHAQRGNARGAVSLLERAGDGIARWIGDPPAGLDVRTLQTHAFTLAARIELEGIGSVSERDLRPTLRVC
jgi:uncharacterized protein